MMKVVISIGSNTHALQNTAKAKDLLTALLPDVVFGKELWTEPRPTPNVPHPTKRYRNCLATATTVLTQEQLTAALKTIEHQMGDSHEAHQRGIVNIDLDLITYGDKTIKERGW